MPADFHTFSGRLRWAIKRRPPEGRERGLRLFKKNLDAAGGESASLSTLQSYLRGDVKPGLDFVSAAAAVLGVREAWLGFNDGSPTEAESRPFDEDDEPQTILEDPILHELVLIGLVEAFPDFWSLPDVARATAMRMVLYAAEQLPQPAGGTLYAADVGRSVGRYLASPFACLGINLHHLSPERLALIVDGLARAIDTPWTPRIEEE